MVDSAANFFYGFTIVLSGISAAVSFAACCLYYIYSRDKQTRLLSMITLLVLVDGVSSLCIIVWYLLNYLDFMNENKLCSLVWPIQLFTFLCAFGLIVLIAERFKRINTGKSKKEHLNFPLKIIPLVSFILTLPTIIFDQTVPSTNVTELISNSNNDINEFCFFASSPIGISINYVSLQVPSFCTILYNLYSYRKGVQALQTASPEVLKKSRFKAGKYLFVLLVVWIPSLTVHAYHSMISPANEPYFPVLVVILLTSCQGIFNAAAYAWEYYPFRQWVYETILKKPYEQNEHVPTFAPGIFKKAPSVLNDPLMDTTQPQVSNPDGDRDSMASTRTSQSKHDHLAMGERSVRFGSTAQHVIYCVYEDDDEEDEEEGVMEATLEETVDHVGKSIFKFVKKAFRSKKSKSKEQKLGKVDEVPDKRILLHEDEEDIEERCETVDRNTHINSNSAFYTTRRREKELERSGSNSRGRSRSRSKSPSRRKSRSRSGSRSRSSSPDPKNVPNKSPQDGNFRVFNTRDLLS